MIDRLVDEELNIDERDVWKIDGDEKADWALEKLSDMQADYERFAMVANAKILKYQHALEAEKKKLDSEQAFLTGKLQEYFQAVEPKETKTQATYKLPSGTLKVTKEKQVIEKDDEQLLEFVKAECPEYVKVREAVDWVNLKKTIDIQGNHIVNKETGEIIEVSGLRVGIKPAEFDIKF